MSDIQYQQYQNLYIFAKDWRKYKPISNLLNKDIFRKQIQFNQYIRLDFINTKLEKPVLIYLFIKNSKYFNNSQNLKRLLVKIREPSDVILVTEALFKVYSKKIFAIFKHLRIKNYLHEHFSLIIPKGPLCYPHRILEYKEVDQLLNSDLCCYLVNLPKILVDDVQCIWIGAEVGDVIEIRSFSDIAGESIHYRVVIIKNGNFISFRENTLSDEVSPKVTSKISGKKTIRPNRNILDHESDQNESDQNESEDELNQNESEDKSNQNESEDELDEYRDVLDETEQEDSDV